jgi:hypothetical protein
MKSINLNFFTGYIAVFLLVIILFVNIPGSELVEQLLNNPEDEKHFLPDKWLIPNLLLIFVLFKSYQLAVKNSRIITGFYQNGYLFSRLRLSANKKMNRLIMSNLISNNILCISIVYICSALILKGFESLCLLLA